MGFSNVTVTGTLVASNGQPVTGAEVTATLSAAIHNDGTTLVGIARTAVTSATGAFSVTVPANTDEGTFPPGSYYTFSCPAAELNAAVVVPASPVVVEFASLPAAPAGAGEVLSVFGRTGAVVAKSGDYTAAQVTGALAATQAANVPVLTATPAEIVESLIAAGIMAAE